MKVDKMEEILSKLEQVSLCIDKIKDMLELGMEKAMAGISPLALVVGFVAAFVTGCLACKLMIGIVKKGKLIWFAVYCAMAGAAVLVWQLTA